MDFQGRYQILEMLNDGEARTFKALQTSSGRTVLLHQLWVERTPPNRPDLASLVSGFLRRATADEMKILIDMGEEAGRVFVVTEDLPIFQDLRQWLQSAAGTPGAAGKASVPESAPSGDSGATVVFGELPSQARLERLASPDATLLFTTPKVLQPPVAPPPPSKARDEPGEFTLLFRPGPQATRSAGPPIPATPVQQPAAPPAFVMAPQPVMPHMQPMAVPVPVAPQAVPPKTGNSKFLVPLIILGGLFLIALGLILFFALKH